MGSATTTNTPAAQVDDLIKQVADEAGLEISAQLASVPSGNLFFIQCCFWGFTLFQLHPFNSYIFII